MHLAALRKFWEAQSIWPGFPLGGWERMEAVAEEGTSHGNSEI